VAASGVPARFGPAGRALDAPQDRAAGAELEKILAWDFDRIVVSHGEPVARDGKAVFVEAFGAFLRQTAYGRRAS
jgi:hypothetical protein